MILGLSISASATDSIGALAEKDLAVLENGAGCWLENAKAEQFICDDMSRAAIKLGRKIKKLERKSGDWNSGFYLCGKNYEYVSADKKITVSAKMKAGE